jgi:hypothetical protein
MGGGSSESKQRPIKKTRREKKFSAIQLKLARQMLDQFQGQAEWQALQRGITPTAIGEMGEMYDPMSVMTPEEKRALVSQGYKQAMEGGDRASALAEREVERIRQGYAPTPEQRALISSIAANELSSGLGDISRFAEREREAIRDELAPRLGLHRSDTPILDRANRIAAEAINAAGRLTSDVRGRESQAMLNYPLAANQAASAASQAQQAMGFSRSDVLADMNQRAFQNRLALTGQVGQQGLGLLGTYNVAAGQESMKPVLSTTQTQSGGGVFYGSSRKIKEILATPNGIEILKALLDLPVAYWRYKDGPDREEHIGTFAEDFSEAFGLGDGKGIDLRDLVGVLLVAIQELGDEVYGLRSEVLG